MLGFCEFMQQEKGSGSDFIGPKNIMRPKTQLNLSLLDWLLN